ncbi:RING-H2 finger protein ATL80 [Sesamum alatum]|uniref:RING-type E3 ubiquitin transferase n=1 Tax=Sesamum alatum TaxID=300844 RepID=A0AAE1YDX1_9LAMI|nr:RING-H2 finger protein ATL80 [Sesamum alatum]
MTARPRHLGGVNSLPPPPTPSNGSSPPVETLDSDFVVILAALICALICVLGLVAVARCSWIRRFTGRNATATESGAPPRSAANKGLKKKVLKSLPKHTYGEDKEQTEKLSDCAICLAEFTAGEEIRVLPQCGHGFHVACIDTWLGSHSSCPSCRQILVVARCQKCGSLPAATGSAAGRAQPELSENHVDRFLP